MIILMAKLQRMGIPALLDTAQTMSKFRRKATGFTIIRGQIAILFGSSL